MFSVPNVFARAVGSLGGMGGELDGELRSVSKLVLRGLSMRGGLYVDGMFGLAALSEDGDTACTRLSGTISG